MNKPEYAYGKPDWKKITPIIAQEIAGSKVRSFGPTSWNRVDEYPLFRAEWRHTDTDLIYSFYHKLGPDPMLNYDNPSAIRINERGHEVVDVEHGEDIALPPSFAELLEKVCDYVFKEHRIRVLEYVPDTLSFYLRVTGAARNHMALDRYTKDFFEIIQANVTSFVPELLPS